MKYIYTALLVALLFVGSTESSHAATGLSIVESKSTYYQKESIQLSFAVETPHPASKAIYYIVNEKTGKKIKLGRFALEKMSIGFDAGLIIEQKPGQYYYLVEYNDGSGVEEYSTDTFTILSRKKAPKIEIRNFRAELIEASTIQENSEYEYLLKLTSESPVNQSDVLGVVRAKCSSYVALFSKGGEGKCTKRISDTLRIMSNRLDFWFAIDADDLEEDVEMSLEYSLYDINNKRLDKEKKTIVLTTDL